MNRFFIILTVLFLSYITYGFYLSQYEFDFFAPEALKTPATILNNYKLSPGVYTAETIGSGTPLSITEEAKQNNTQFLLYTDINPIVNLPVDQYLTNIGQLYGARFDEAGRSYVIYSAENKKVQDYDYRSSHPNFLKIKVLDEDVENKYPEVVYSRDGYDVFNLKRMLFQSLKNSKISTFWSLIFYPFNPRLALIRLYEDPVEALSFFDLQSQKEKTNLYLSTEATAKTIPFTNWLIKFPSYQRVLGISSERVLMTSELTGDIEKDAPAVFKALKEGSFYISMDTLGDSTGFEAYLFSRSQKAYTQMGEAAQLTDDLKLSFRLPHEPQVFHEVVLFRNGERYSHLNTYFGDFAITEKGVYRLQVRITAHLPLPDGNKWLNWIYTNNFYVE